jgi:threonine synthase
VQYDLGPDRGRQLRQDLAQRPWTLWRYRELLPLERAGDRIDLGEGGTPLVAMRRLFRPGFEVWIKQESGNPTGSFKARGLSLAVNRARELGAPGVELPSAGNAALAATAYAAAAGLPCRVALPADTPSVIIARCRLHGAQVLSGGRTLVEAAERLADSDLGYWDLSTFKEPYRVEGKKTMGYELAEQLDWKLPDWIVYPTGGGTGIVAMAKAFAELRRLGLLAGETCRFVVVQMEGCSPVVEAFRRGAEEMIPWAEPDTEVWGLRVPRSVADFLILRALRESQGEAVVVAETTVQEMQESAAKEEGLTVGPEGAAALLGAEQLVEKGVIGEGDRVVVFQTGDPANYS